MKPKTGTHVYTLLKCRRAVALDLVGDRDLKRELLPHEEFVLKRGRDHEDVIVEELGWPEPEFERGDWAQGAARTAEMLREGIEGVSQGILLGDDRLGIPDLLRREPGASDLGDFHYVVGDIKSSAAPRSDQILQVVFYSGMLAELQGREPDYGYLVLKDGREERFEIADYAPAMRQVERELDAIRSAPDDVRPFFGMACESCSWSDVCVPTLQDQDDLSLLPGVTPALRSTLESADVRTCTALASSDVAQVASASRLEPALVQRLQTSARARSDRTTLWAERSATPREDAALLHVLTDAFADRVLYFGVLHPADEDGEIRDAVPATRDDEWSAFQEVLHAVPRGARILHYGRSLPKWFEEHAHGREQTLAIESRFVDLALLFRGAVTLPGPAFTMSDYVSLVLDRDPHRTGHVGESAMRAIARDDDWLREKGRSDLRDLAALRARILETQATDRV